MTIFCYFFKRYFSFNLLFLSVLFVFPWQLFVVAIQKNHSQKMKLTIFYEQKSVY